MAEISCFVDVNNSKLTFMMSLDSEVNWQSFTEGISKYLSDYDLSSAPRFSYEDEDGDRVYFESDLELKEALDYASNLDLFIIFVNATEKVQVDTQAIPQAIPQPFPRAIPQVAIPESVPQVPSQEPSQEPTLLERVGEMLRKEIPQLSELYENFIESEEAKEGIKFVEQLVNEVADKNVLNDLQTFVNDNLKSVKSEKKCKEKKVKRVKKVKKEPSPSNKALHHAICDYCSNKIVGIRYKCLFCADYDLCETCEEINCKNQFHDATHYFAKIIKPVHQQHRGPVPRPVHREGCPARFQRIPKLEEKVQSLENELSQIKALLLQNNNNNIPQEEEKQSEAIAQQESEPVEEQIQQEEQEAPQQEEEPVSQLSPAEEQCLNALKEMGFDVHASLVSENQCDLLQILEKLVL